MSTVTGLPAGTPEPYVTRAQLADLMGVSVSTIDRLTAEGMPSVIWSRRSRRYRASTAIAWATARRRDTRAA